MLSFASLQHQICTKYLGKEALMEGKGTGPHGRCSPAIPEHVPPSKVTSEAASVVIPIYKKGWGLPGA